METEGDVGVWRNGEGRYYGGGGGSFWTVCPYCYFLFEYEKVYEDCCLRCTNCGTAFHAVAIQLPYVVEGRDEYYCCLGVFGVKFGPFDFDVEVHNNEGDANYVTISDDSASNISEDDCVKQKDEPRVSFESPISGVNTEAESKRVRTDEVGNKTSELRNLQKSMKNVKAIVPRPMKMMRTGLTNPSTDASCSSVPKEDLHERSEKEKDEKNELMCALVSPARPEKKINVKNEEGTNAGKADDGGDC